MFGNFLYFIVALLIYTTYQPASEPAIHPFYTFILFIGLILVFAIGAHRTFKTILAKIDQTSFSRIEHQYNSALNRYSIMSIFIYAIDIYVLNIGAWVHQMTIFQIFIWWTQAPMFKT